MEFVKGMTWGWIGTRGQWKTTEAEHSMEEMVHRLGVNWTVVAFQAQQKTAHSTEINYKGDPVVTTEEVYWAIEKAKSLGLKVILKPVVNCMNGTWRAHINFFDQDVPGEPSWIEWFKSYEEYILYYARMAEETKCEMFCIGCEMVQADKREVEWRRLIKRVREVYSGTITYNCDKYQEDRLTWWDAVDVISSSGYYPAGTWDKQIKRIEKVVKEHNKPFFFMEAGCPSRTGSSSAPNDWSHVGEANTEEQNDYYKEMFKKLDSVSWFSGYALWDWPAKLYKRENAKYNADYCVYGKKAEKTIKEYYSKK